MRQRPSGSPKESPLRAVGARGYSKKLRSRPLFSLRQTRKKTTTATTQTTSSPAMISSVKVSSAMSFWSPKPYSFQVRSSGLPLARLLGRRRGRVADAADAAPLDLLDEEAAALVPDLLAGAEDASGAREQEAGHRRVTRLLGELQLEAAVGVAHGQHAVEEESAVRLGDDLLAHLFVVLVVDLADYLFE